MSVAFDEDRNICLTGSEAEAVNVAVDTNGGWLKHRIDLDSKGEILRVGSPRLLTETCSAPNFAGGLFIRLLYSLQRDIFW